MNKATTMKDYVLLSPQTVSHGATVTSSNLDTQGADFAVIKVVVNATNTAGTTLSVLKLQECDTTVATSFADVTGAVGGTDATGGFTIPALSAFDDKVARLHVDLRSRMRYIRLLATVPNSDTTSNIQIAAVGELSRLEKEDTSVLGDTAVNLTI